MFDTHQPPNQAASRIYCGTGFSRHLHDEQPNFEEFADLYSARVFSTIKEVRPELARYITEHQAQLVLAVSTAIGAADSTAQVNAIIWHLAYAETYREIEREVEGIKHRADLIKRSTALVSA